MEEGNGQPIAARAGRTMWRWLLGAFLVLLAVAGGLYVYRSRTSAPVEEALRGESGAVISVYPRAWLSDSEIVFDIRKIDGEVSPADMTRKLLKSAEALKARRYERVYLAYRGREKFYLDGDYFRQLGEEYAYQNPVYTIRTLPERVYNLDGTPAFGTWTGGWLGVLGKQLEDANEFHRRWWMTDGIGDL
jgi:hypothetical protein